MDWSQWPVLEAQRQDLDDRGTRVVFRDLRFMYPEQRGSALGAFVQLDDKLNVVDEGFLSSRRDRGD
jgi:hypothetical protein